MVLLQDLHPHCAIEGISRALRNWSSPRGSGSPKPLQRQMPQTGKSSLDLCNVVKEALCKKASSWKPGTGSVHLSIAAISTLAGPWRRTTSWRDITAFALHVPPQAQCLESRHGFGALTFNVISRERSIGICVSSGYRYLSVCTCRGGGEGVH